ncbi:MAG TPA: TSUP family transporter [Feifaniaceae bacterium]|nr:TSUP family transporter [Feifaniaceae bacterium]
MELSLTTYLIVCPLVFLAGFVDSIAGGGGLISLPAYLLAGLPAHETLGTNKTAMSIGTFTAALKYLKAGQIDWRVALLSAAASFVGAMGGSTLSLMIPEQTLRIVMLAILPAVALFLLVKRNFGTASGTGRELSRRRTAAASILIGLVIGCYDGLVGPGTGTFLILAFSAFLGFDLLKSSGCAKVANLMSNIASMIVFLINGKVLFLLAIPAAAFASAGNYFGAKLAIKGGAKYVRYTVFVVIGLLIVKMAVDLL